MDVLWLRTGLQPIAGSSGRIVQSHWTIESQAVSYMIDYFAA